MVGVSGEKEDWRHLLLCSQGEGEVGRLGLVVVVVAPHKDEGGIISGETTAGGILAFEPGGGLEYKGEIRGSRKEQKF